MNKSKERLIYLVEKPMIIGNPEEKGFLEMMGELTEKLEKREKSLRLAYPCSRFIYSIFEYRISK